MKGNQTLLLIVQAILLSLMHFAVGMTRYATIALLVLNSFVLLMSTTRKRWTAADVFTFETGLLSPIFLVFAIYAPGLLTTLFGLVLIVLSIMAALISSTLRISAPQPMHEIPASIETYDIRDLERDIARAEREEKRSQSKDDARYKAKAVAYELEREASELKRAEKYVRKKETLAAEEELVREAKQLKNAERAIKQIEALNKQQKRIQKAVKKAKPKKR